MPHYKLSYFALRMRAEPIRMLLSLAEKPYEDVRVSFEEWPSLKTSTPYGKMPLLEVDGKALPQSLAICRYLAKEYGFAGKNAFECAWADAIADQMAGFFMEYRPWYIVRVKYVEGDEQELYEEVYKPAITKHLPLMVKLLKKSSSGWLVGDSLTYADIVVACTTDTLKNIDPYYENVVWDYPELADHRKKATVPSHSQQNQDLQVFDVPAIRKHVETRANDPR